MDQDTGMGTPQPPPPAGPREYVVEPERKRPVLLVIIAVLMILLGLFTAAGPALMGVSENFMDMALKNKDQMPPAQVAKIEQQKEMLEKYKEHAGVMTPVLVIEGLLLLALGIGLIMRKEWARIGSMVVLALGAVWGLLDLFALNWVSQPGQWGPVVTAAIYLLVVYYLSNVGWAFRPKEAPRATLA